MPHRSKARLLISKGRYASMPNWLMLVGLRMLCQQKRVLEASGHLVKMHAPLRLH